MNSIFLDREQARASQFEAVWNDQLDAVFADVAPYYDQANLVASFGLWNGWRRKFISTIDTRPGANVLDVCAGTNAIGIELLNKEPSLRVHAIDRSEAMQEVGRERAEARGMSIDSTIGDVHQLPFPDNHFDIVTLQFASRHLRLAQVLAEIKRVLKPGGWFHHCDMLRPGNRFVEEAYYIYLRMCLTVTARVFGSSETALDCRRYFIQALRMFYSPKELSELLAQVGFSEVAHQPIFAGMLAFHKARKTIAD